MLTKGHSIYRGETEKLLQLRDGGILLSSHQHKPPFFRFPPPPIDIYEFQVYNYFSTLFILALEELWFDEDTEIYNNATAENWKNSA